MMRTIWTIVSVLAVANLLALAAFMGWLVLADRMDLGRVREIRAVLSETVSEQRARGEAEEQARLEAEAEAARLAAADPGVGEPVTAAQLVNLKLEFSELDEQRLMRLRREFDDLRRTLEAERRQLDEQRRALLAEIDEFNETRRRIAEVEGSEQFRKALATYRTLRPAEAKAMMQQLLGPGVDEAGAMEVVSYLNAMDERERARIISEFQKEDPALAADLLQRLRNHGIRTADAGGS
jgi:hypothetical protein